MSVFYTLSIGGEKHKVETVCECGKCSLLSSTQLEDLRNKVKSYEGQDSPEIIKVICN